VALRCLQKHASIASHEVEYTIGQNHAVDAYDLVGSSVEQTLIWLRLAYDLVCKSAVCGLKLVE